MERLFHVLHQPSYNLAMWSPFALLLYPSKKDLSPSVWAGQEENISGNSTERSLLILKISRVLPVPTGRVGIGR